MTTLGSAIEQSRDKLPETAFSWLSGVELARPSLLEVREPAT